MIVGARFSHFVFLASLPLLGCDDSDFTIEGPQNVPDFTAYTYKETNCKTPDWSISDSVGTIESGQDTQQVVIKWGKGAKDVTVSAACGTKTGKLAVKVMKVTIENPTVTQGQFQDGGSFQEYHYEHLGDGKAPPAGKPGIKFDAKITVDGPPGSKSAGPDKITVGFVQVLREIPIWEGDYKEGDKQLIAKFTNAPPWHDQVEGKSDPLKAWYTNENGANFNPTVGKLFSNIVTWDSPTPGWEEKNSWGKELLEATATWKFDTFICVQTADEEKIYFNRAKASWTAEYHWQSPDKVTGSKLTAPNEFTSLDDYTQPTPKDGMLVNKGIKPPNLTWEKK